MNPNEKLTLYFFIAVFVTIAIIAAVNAIGSYLDSKPLNKIRQNSENRKPEPLFFHDTKERQKTDRIQ